MQLLVTRSQPVTLVFLLSQSGTENRRQTWAAMGKCHHDQSVGNRNSHQEYCVTGAALLQAVNTLTTRREGWLFRIVYRSAVQVHSVRFLNMLKGSIVVWNVAA